MKTVSRRELMKAFGAAGLLLWPALKATRAEGQAGRKAAKRWIFMHVQNAAPPHYRPKGEGTAFSLAGTLLESLTPFQNDLIFSNVKTARSSGHPNTACILTGNPETGLFTYGKGPSINSIMAEKLGARDPVNMLNLWVSKNEKQGNRNTISYDTKGNFIAPERSAARAYALIANLLRCNAPATMPRPQAPVVMAPNVRQQGIMDLLKEDLKDASRLLGMGKEERLVLETHQESLHALEARFKNMLGGAIESGAVDPTQLCGPGGLVESLKTRSANAGMSIPDLSRFMIDVTVVAMALDLTRTATIFYLSEGGECRTNGDFLTFNGGKISDNLHEVSHAHNGRTTVSNAAGKMDVVTRWNVGEFAYLLKSLQALPDGGSNMLKTSLVNLAPVMGWDHDDKNLVWITAGGGGYLKTGTSNMTEEWHPRLLLSQLHAMGIMDVPLVGSSATQNGGNTPLLATA